MEDGKRVLVVNIDSACCRGKDYHYREDGPNSYFNYEYMEPASQTVVLIIKDALVEYDNRRS